MNIFNVAVVANLNDKSLINVTIILDHTTDTNFPYDPIVKIPYLFPADPYNGYILLFSLSRCVPF
jgi:hypothetical protein